MKQSSFQVKRQPREIHEKLEWVKRAKELLQKQGCKNPSLRQVANLLGVSAKTISKWCSLVTTGNKQTVEKPLFNVWGV